MRRGLYVTSTIAATGLLVELGWAVVDRVRMRLRDAAR